jgi:hypothetical protein
MLTAMKYYIYISDAKVDMLLPQVPHQIKQKVATEYGLDIKIFKAQRSVESESEDNRISRLEAVLSFIQEYGKVGSVCKPDDYIEDVMTMRFVNLGDNDSIVYMTGHQNDTVVGLGGSAKHLISARPDDASGIRFPSLSIGILDFVTKRLAAKEVAGPHDLDELHRMIRLEELVRDDPSMRIDFFAKSLLKTPEPFAGKNGILATPLYLALAGSV